MPDPFTTMVTAKPLHVRRIHLANGDTLEDKTVSILGGFLIVEADFPEQAPTWYNLSEVTALQEVTLLEKTPQGGKIFWL